MKDLRIRRTYKLLSEALLNLMRKEPFEKISVKDICDEALVHRTTFYTHFQDKYDLLRYCMNELELPFEKNDITEDSFEGYKSYYMSVARDIIGTLEKNGELFRSVLKKNKEDSLFTSFQYALTQKISEKLEKCRANDLEIPMPIPFLASFFSGACISALSWWLENDMPISSENLVSYLSAMITEKTLG